MDEQGDEKADAKSTTSYFLGKYLLVFQKRPDRGLLICSKIKRWTVLYGDKKGRQ